jgi:hypothetical protein
MVRIIAALVCAACLPLGAKKPEKPRKPSEFEQVREQFVAGSRKARENFSERMKAEFGSGIYEDGAFLSALSDLAQFEKVQSDLTIHQSQLWNIRSNSLGAATVANEIYKLKTAVITERDHTRLWIMPGCRTAHSSYDSKPASQLSRNQVKILNICEAMGY